MVVSVGHVGWGVDNAVSTITDRMNLLPQVHYWILTMEANDLCYKTAAQFVTAAGNWVDTVKAAGRVAILAKAMWVNGNTYCQANQPGYNSAIDTLGASKGVAVIDLYTDSYNHSEYYGSSGDPHPNENGCTNLYNKKIGDYLNTL
jgi:hypothetical protein